MKTLILVLSLATTTAFAETADLTVEGMHCSGCKKIITKKVCESDKVKAVAETCEVQVVDADKQIGKILITTKKDAKLDVDQVKEELKNAGEGYKLTKVELKDMVQKELAAGEVPAKGAVTETTTTTTTTEKTVTDAAGKTTTETKTEKKVKKIKKLAKKGAPKEERPVGTVPETPAADMPKTETKKETK